MRTTNRYQCNCGWELNKDNERIESLGNDSKEEMNSTRIALYFPTKMWTPGNKFLPSFPLLPLLQHTGGPQQHCSVSSEEAVCRFMPFSGHKATAALYLSQRPRQNRQAEPHSSARRCHGNQLLPGSPQLREDWELARPKNKDVGGFFPRCSCVTGKIIIKLPQDLSSYRVFIFCRLWSPFKISTFFQATKTTETWQWEDFPNQWKQETKKQERR